MPDVEVSYGESRVRLALPAGLAVRVVRTPPVPPAADPLEVVARALDRPHEAAPLAERARGAGRVAIVVPDRTRPASADVYLLPVLARLARAGLDPGRIRVVVARGIHPTSSREEVERIVGAPIMAALRPVQSTPETPEMNVSLGADPELGDVRVSRVVADADLVLLTGPVMPHHLAGWGGGPKALVPGVAERETVLAAHRLTLRTVVRPDGSLSFVTGSTAPNPFREALLRVARSHGRCFLLAVVLDDLGGVAAASAGEVGAAHEAAIQAWRRSRPLAEPEPADLVIVGAGPPRDLDLIQAHKSLLAAAPWARPGAPIVWLARAPGGAGHAALLPWFEAGRLDRHLAALRRAFHPYGLTAYSIRRLARSHPVHVVSEVSPDVLRPMGLLPFRDPAAALAHAWKGIQGREGARAVVLPDA